MTHPKISATATKSSDILSCSIEASHASMVHSAILRCTETNLNLGSYINISMGYDEGNFGTVFSGVVKKITKEVPQNTHSVEAQSHLSDAVDYFIATPRQDEPLKYENIYAEDLVVELLRMAGLACSASNTYFLLGVNGTPVEINLTTVADKCDEIAKLLAFKLYNTPSGIFFGDNHYGGAPSGVTLDNDNSMDVSWGMNDRDKRDRVVVYGINDISASAGSGDRTVVFVSDLICSESIAQMTANYNLALLNKNTYTMNLTCLGDYRLYPHKDATAVFPQFGVSSSWGIFSVSHEYSQSSGYTTNVELRL